MRWLNELIAAESSGSGPDGPDPDGGIDADAIEPATDTDVSDADFRVPATRRDVEDNGGPGSRDSARRDSEQLKTPVAQRTSVAPREEGEPDHG